MKTQIVNLRTHKKTNVMRTDRTTIFGNPYRIGSRFTRKQSIEKYRRYFYLRIRDSEEFRQAVQELEGHILGCWCAPLACHGDIIVEYLEKKTKKEKE
ncbi:hypothetical protein LCGC14_2317450 [marine sediment metagenome]|uniref:DUF4326 domain-containing protein n=1 Tax=marine sediment metagenome TaxID=412755 RepID=A0A0F9D6D4_9ZZZZ